MIKSHPDLNVSDGAIEALEQAYPGIRIPISSAGRPSYLEAAHNGTPIVRHVVKVTNGFAGNSADDLAGAWRALGTDLIDAFGEVEGKRRLNQLRQTHVWHHEWDGHSLQLIPRTVHNVFRHTGGDAFARAGVYREVFAGLTAAALPTLADAADDGTSKEFGHIGLSEAFLLDAAKYTVLSPMESASFVIQMQEDAGLLMEKAATDLTDANGVRLMEVFDPLNWKRILGLRN
jgi:hypothetical protein